MAAGEARRKNAVRLRIARLRRHLNLGVLVEAAVGPAWLFATIFVTWRVFVHQAVPVVGVVCGLAAAVGAAFGLSRRAFTEAQAAVLADRRAGTGGLLLTRLELPIGAWEFELNQKLKELTLPSLAIERPAGLVLGAVAFVALGLLVPQASRPRTSNAAAASRVEALEEKLLAVAREEPSAAASADELERLRAELAQGTFDGPDWEAADALDEALDRRAAEAAAELAGAEQAAQRLGEAIASAQGADAIAREREALERALLELSQGRADALESPEGSQGAGAPHPSAAEVERLRHALAERRRALAEGLREPRDPSRRASRAPSSGGSENAATSPSGRPGASGAHASGAHDSRAVAQGAEASRGGEAGRLVFGGQAELDPGRLKLELLPPGHGGEDEGLYGLQARDPRPSVTGHRSAALGSLPAGERAEGYDEGGLLPRNRALIRHYFDSEQSSIGRHRVRAVEPAGSAGRR